MNAQDSKTEIFDVFLCHNNQDKPEIREISQKLADVKELLPRKHKQVIEIRLPGNLDEFSDKERDRILTGLNALLEVGEVRVTRAMAGSSSFWVSPVRAKPRPCSNLAANLLARAKADAKERVPIVLNLSNWKKKQPLVEWIVVELSVKYRVPVKIARSWLQKDYLVPLLDGLDEVPTALQPDCVAAITPLLLKIMSLAFQGAGGNELATQKGDSPEARQKQIFRLYVDEMFQRKGSASREFPKEKIIVWLSWLAGKMKEHSRSVFLVEGLEPSWLGTRAKQAAYGTLVALSLGLIFGMGVGLIFGASAGRIFGAGAGLSGGLSVGLMVLLGIGLGCWSESPLKNGVMSGSIGGLLIFGLGGGLGGGLITGLSAGLIGGLGVGSLNRITLVETLSWKWNQFWKRTIPGSILGLIGGLSVWLSAGLIRGLSVGLLYGLIFGLVSGLVGGFTDRVKVGKASPNQGIKLSRTNSLTVGLIVGLTSGLIVGLIVGLNRGGSAVIKHYALRLTLWLNGYTPFNFIKFLDRCAKLILLKKVGGGYIFIHRMLLEYFAELDASRNSASRR